MQFVSGVASPVTRCAERTFERRRRGLQRCERFAFAGGLGSDLFQRGLDTLRGEGRAITMQLRLSLDQRCALVLQARNGHVRPVPLSRAPALRAERPVRLPGGSCCSAWTKLSAGQLHRAAASAGSFRSGRVSAARAGRGRGRGAPRGPRALFELCGSRWREQVSAVLDRLFGACDFAVLGSSTTRASATLCSICDARALGSRPTRR
jgi:hypothetical protein